MPFEDFLSESTAAEEAHKNELTAAGWGLWKDKDGKVVKKTDGKKLVDVRGSEANINHYHSNIPLNKKASHAEHDQSSDIVKLAETPGTHRSSDVTKRSINEHSAVHPKHAAKLHDALVSGGYQYDPSPFGHMYRNGKTAVMISNEPEVSHKRGGKEKDHHSIVIQTEHGNAKTKK